MPLRLKSLELQGYKTFVSRTVLEFSGGITAIVGPNGSGKSNIADAVRWVLGEQSYALLRGKKTEDMIFSGSEHRPRAGMAQATVTFDNSDAWLPVDFSEVELSRHAYRDGRNEYLLNSQHVRLRDINELLAQSGLSERTFTILGQGLVDASLALKAEERRRLFEEAAGVGLYRTRREEALRRLEHTERNLERVTDIMSELEPRLRTLERQAKRAMEYARAQQDLRVLLLEWYGYHWGQVQQRQAETRAGVRAQEKRLRLTGEAGQKVQTEYAAFRERFSGLRAELNSWHRQSAEYHNQREAVSRELAVLEERRRALTGSHQSVLADQELVAVEEKIARERLAEADGESQRQRSDYQDAQDQLAAAQNALLTRQNERSTLEENLIQLRGQTESFNQQRAESHARLDELKMRIEAQGQKLEQINQAILSAKSLVQKTEEQHGRARTQREGAEDTLRKAEEKLESSLKRVSELEAGRRQLMDKRAEHEAEHSRLNAQLEVLAGAEQSLAGYAEGARFLLDAARQSRLKGTRGALSAALDVPAEFETAITAALGDTLDAVVLDASELEEALRLLESDGAGRAALIPLAGKVNHSVKKPKDEDCLGLASELVNAPDDLQPAVQLMLGGTLIVRGRATARRLIRDLPPHARVVTLKGEVFRGDGLVIAGKTAASSTLSRPRQKRELEAALAALGLRLKEAMEGVERVSSELSSMQKEAAKAEVEVHDSRSGVETALAAEQQARLESESASRQLGWQKEQLAQLESEGQQAASIRQKLLDTQAEVERQSTDLVAQLKVQSARLAELSLDEVQTQVSYWSTRAAVAEQGLKGAQGAKEQRSDEARRLESRKAELASRLQELESNMAELDKEKAALREREVSLNSQIEELRLKIEPAERDLESAEQQEAHMQEAEAKAQSAAAEAERFMNQAKLDLARSEDMLNTLREKIVDDFGLVEFDYADEVSGPVPLPFEGLVQQLPKVSELKLDLEEQLTSQRARLRRMGAINAEAKQEFERESQRYEFLKEQVEDLHKAEADLRKVIAELDELTRRDFIRTYEEVDKEFRQIFVRLFGGGSAKLSLTDPKNLIETGIEIEARLPGHRSQGLALLSGGERSLTAIALVFALLKVSPTPVCVLDEVDAMLDEANVGRFRDLLSELSIDTQFIIITHNRSTVQAAEIIYGVTMGRDSASQVISLQLDQVTDEMLVRG
jgi:chromosome segregation protein